MTRTERTKKGHWLDIDAKASGFIVLICWSERTFAEKGKSAERTQWALSHLGIPDGTTLSEAIRMTENWLAYFEDDELVERGSEAVIIAFQSYEMVKPTASGVPPPGGQQGQMN
jgi:hypothetical protein